MLCCSSLVERCRKMEDSTQKIKLNIQTHRLGHVSSLFRPVRICCLRPLALNSTTLPFRKVCLEPCAYFPSEWSNPIWTIHLAFVAQVDIYFPAGPYFIIFAPQAMTEAWVTASAPQLPTGPPYVLSRYLLFYYFCKAGCWKHVHYFPL